VKLRWGEGSASKQTYAELLSMRSGREKSSSCAVYIPWREMTDESLRRLTAIHKGRTG
jgi:hypothetical protein